MSAPGRATATLAAVLILVGAAGWAVTPVLLLGDRIDGLDAPAAIRAGALLLGCLVGGASATSVLPAVPRAIVVGAAALAAGIVLTVAGGGLALTTQARLVAGAVAATAVGGWLGARMWPGLGKMGAAAFMQLAVITGVVLVHAYVTRRLGDTPTPWVPLLLAMIAGGAITVRLLPEVTIGHIAMGWIVTSIATLGLAFLLASQRFFVLIAVIVTAFIVPFPIALAALGAALARRRGPPPAELPSATIRE